MRLKKFATKYTPDLICLFLIFLFSFAILASQFLTGSWGATQDDFRYLQIFEQFREAFTNGIFYPRWLPDTYKGFGYPMFVFYQPGIFYVALPFSFMTNMIAAMQCAVIFLCFSGGCGVYLTARKLTDKATGLFCALLFLLTPYLYVNLYFRGDLSELTAMLMTPWPLYFLLLLRNRTLDGGRLAVLVASLALSLTGVIISHPATALFFAPVFLFISFCMSFMNNKGKQKIFILTVAFSFLIGLALSSPYWLTAFIMKKHVWFDLALKESFSAEKKLPRLGLIFSPFWKTSEMSLQLGALHFMLAFVGFIFMRKNRFIQGLFGAYLILIFAMTPFSSFFWKHIKLVRYVQFPWRIFSVTAILQALCASGIFFLLNKKQSWKWKLQIIIYPGIIILFVFFNRAQFNVKLFSNEFTISQLERNRKLRLESPYAYQTDNETLPRTVRRPAPSPRGDKPFIQVSSPNSEIETMPGHSKFNIRYAIKAGDAMKVLINQLYFPGMEIFLDGLPLSDEEIRKSLTYDGRAYLDIQPGAHTLELYYDGPPGWKIRNIIIGIILLGYLIFLAKEDAIIRNLKNSSPCPDKEKATGDNPRPL